jgi:pimeloyl-ACP methyl ester carboxylesterase
LTRVNLTCRVREKFPFYSENFAAVKVKMLASITELLAQHPEKPLHIIGYSFGGALGTLAAAEFLHEKLIDANKLQLWTYGCPR